MKAHAVGRLGVADVYLPGNRNLPILTTFIYVRMYYFYVWLAHLCFVKKM
jgi:hypothetical protein